MPESVSREISEPVQEFLDVVETPASKAASEGTKIKVHAVISKMAFLYEKVRNVVDYNEEQLLRKNATFRILKRKTLGFVGSHRPKPFGRGLIAELIRAGYLENDTIPEKKAEDVNVIIQKFYDLLDSVPELGSERDTRERTLWVLGIAACEIEESISPMPREHALVNLMYTVTKEDMMIKGELPKEEVDLQKFLAVRRALLRTDDMLIRYELWKRYSPGWTEGDKETIRKAISRFSVNASEIQYQTHHPLTEPLFRFFKKYSILFHVLRDVVENNEEEVRDTLATPERLSKITKEVTKHNFKKVRSRLTRSVVRTVIYIFITKMFLALVLEIPIDVYFENGVNPQSLGINILFPPMLMLFIALTIHVPIEKNTKKIIQGIQSIVYGGRTGVEQQKITPPGARGAAKTIIFRFIYTLVFLLPFVLIWIGLQKLDFSVVSTLIFIFFLTIISFFGIKLRQRAREIIVLDQKENVFSLILDFFSIPILRVGRWFSVRFSKINVFVFILDILIEAPFKAFIEAFEEWLAYLREKKEEI